MVNKKIIQKAKYEVGGVFKKSPIGTYQNDAFLYQKHTSLVLMREIPKKLKDLSPSEYAKWLDKNSLPNVFLIVAVFDTPIEAINFRNKLNLNYKVHFEQ